MFATIKNLSMPFRAGRAIAILLAALLSLTAAHAQGTRLAGTWAAATDVAPAAAVSQSARNVLRISAGGTGVQLSLSNVFGDRDVTITSVTIGLQSTGASLVPQSVSAVTFNGQSSVTIPKGQRVLSDVMPRSLAAQSKVAVSMYLPGSTGQMTGHALGWEDVYFSQVNVDASSSTDGSLYPYVGQFKVYVDAIYLQSATALGTVAALGDSITDGYDSGYGQDTRWPDRLADRLIAAGTPMGVMNLGIGSNRVVTDNPPGQGGQSALNRLDRDVLSIQGLSTVILFEGINDLSAGYSSDQVIAGLKTLTDRIHAAGKCVVGGTITPNGNASAAAESQRQAVNRFIRSGVGYDAVVDFDAALRDPSNPAMLRAAYDVGDKLHPNQAGNKALADSIDLATLRCAAQSDVNLALGKAATQSSTAFNGPPALAVDGGVSGAYFSGSVTHTAGASQDWWQVDLGQVATLSSVRLWNRTDCCADRLANFHVLASPTDMTGRTLAQLLADATVKQIPVNAFGGDPSLSIALGATNARYVRVQLAGQNYLSLAEVQVFGHLDPNLALGKTATQSSSGFGGIPGRAVDGNTDGNYFGGSVSHTAAAASQDWWQVDLQKVVTLSSVRLWNRTDCCAERLANFYVLVSDTDMTGRALGQLLADQTVKQVQVASFNGNPSIELAMAGAKGRYLRVQLAGSNYLSLAEVQVFGH